MLTDRQIEATARDQLKEGWTIESREVYTDPDGVLFQIDWTDHLCTGAFFVMRQTGSVVHLGLHQIIGEGVKYWVEFYEDGWTTREYLLTVESVRSERELAELFVKNGLSYTVLRNAHGAVWRIETKYTEGTVCERLQDLPTVFRLRGQALKDMLPELRQVAIFEYSLNKETPHCSWHPEDYSEEELGPQW